VKTIGLGESPNDLPLLSMVDVPVLLQKSDGGWEDCTIPKVRRVEASGPAGWSRFMREFFARQKQPL
jgi:predicted mannosyl-3-phosphoglycerate phosphatase (HAD superfamily)